jgi:hypothetical protein
MKGGLREDGEGWGGKTKGGWRGRGGWRVESRDVEDSSRNFREKKTIVFFGRMKR